MENWVAQTLADLARHEGFRKYAYPDPLSELHKKYPPKKWGWGYKPADAILREIGEPASKGAPWTVGIGFTRGVGPSTVMTREEAFNELLPELIEHLEVLDRLLPDWETYPDVIKTVLANLAFNLGSRLGQFKNTLKYFAAGEWNKAAANLKKSLWYRQVGERSEELVKRLQTLKIEQQYLVPDFSNVEGKVTSTEQLI